MRVATAPVSWGVLEFEGQGAGQSWPVVLDEMVAAGYSGTELGPYGFMPTDPSVLQAALDERGLRLLSAFVPVRLAERAAHAEGLAAARKVGALLAGCGCEQLVLSDDNCAVPHRLARAGRITSADALDEAGWQSLAQGVNGIALTLRSDYGLQTVFHHHCGGFVETPGEIDHFLALTDPATVGLCLDTGHYAYGGGDPLDCLRQHGDRVRYVHLKDVHPAILSQAKSEGWNYFEAVAAGVFCELGQGSVDFRGILQALRVLSYDGWLVVEQDIAPGRGTPLASAQRNRSYLRGLGL